MGVNNNNTPTLCWDCKNCTNPTVCSWARDLTPVNGWKAKKTTLSTRYHPFDSFLVEECPLFERDAFGGGHTENLFGKKESVSLDDNDVANLASAIIERMIEDWRFLDCGKLNNITFCGSRIRKKDCVEFFFSPWFETLLAAVTDITPDQVRRAIGVPEYLRPLEQKKGVRK